MTLYASGVVLSGCVHAKNTITAFYYVYIPMPNAGTMTLSYLRDFPSITRTEQGTVKDRLEFHS